MAILDQIYLGEAGIIFLSRGHLKKGSTITYFKILSELKKDSQLLSCNLQLKTPDLEDENSISMWLKLKVQRLISYSSLK